MHILDQRCQRLIAARMLPGRDGQPVHVQVHVDLATLHNLPGGSGLEAGWSPARAAASPGSVYLTGTGAEAAACDATLTPVVSGHIDWTTLDQLTTLFLNAHSHGPGHHRDQHPARGQDGNGREPAPEPYRISPALHKRLRGTLLHMSITLLSGPGGLASCLRATSLGEPYNSLSQPLDIGAPTPEVPPHLRKAVTQRDQHCQFPGCTQPPSVCQVHHLIPRSKGGPTALGNLRLLCRFHHLVVIHRWGWKLTCHPDGTTTATSPNGRVLHSHGPPGLTA
jgi:HNH endonuclease